MAGLLPTVHTAADVAALKTQYDPFFDATLKTLQQAAIVEGNKPDSPAGQITPEFMAFYFAWKTVYLPNTDFTFLTAETQYEEGIRQVTDLEGWQKEINALPGAKAIGRQVSPPDTPTSTIKFVAVAAVVVAAVYMFGPAVRSLGSRRRVAHA